MEPILKEFPHQFESRRLLIRAPRPGDGAAVHAALVASWDRFRPWFPWAAAATPPTLEETEARIRRAHARFLQREDLQLLLFLKQAKTLVGSSGLHRIDWSVPRFEIGFWLRTGYEGQGYMSEAVAAIADFAFERLGARRVEIRCDATNERSAAVARRCGFQWEGTLRHEERHPLTGTLRDTLVFARVRDD